MNADEILVAQQRDNINNTDSPLNSANCLNEERSLVASLARDDNERLKGNGRATAGQLQSNGRATAVRLVGGLLVVGNWERSLVAFARSG
jgi:hypothetical protein